jgi:hypothetical protein
VEKRHYTRKELGAELRKRGFPISDSTLNKLCAPAINRGPPVAGWFGIFALYNLEDGIAWAEARLRPERAALSQDQIEHIVNIVSAAAT